MNRESLIKRSQGGFTLVEMAVVLIIIGLIIGAVLKGQDLIENARAKQFANFIRQAEVTAFTFYDRNGRWPGDTGDGTAGSTEPNGIIGDEPTNNETVTDIKDEISNFEWKKRIGSQQYYIYYGQYVGPTGALNYPAIVVAKNDTNNINNTGTDVFRDADLLYAKSFDTAIDGDESAVTGRVVALSTADPINTADVFLIDYAAAGTDIVLAGGTAKEWDDAGHGSIRGVVYFFDRGSI